VRIGVVIVNWNAGSLLPRCLMAVHEQTRPADRLIVVDNASTDGSCDAIPGIYPTAEVIRLERNLGFAAAVNVGWQAASDCEWIALLNPDAFPEPSWLARLVEAAVAEPAFACFASELRMAGDPRLLDGAGDVYHVSGLSWRRGHQRPLASLDAVPREVFSPCAAAALYRRDALAAVGGFDESLFCYFEDIDLGFRLRLEGHRCLYVPGAVVHHVGSALSGRRSAFTVYHGHRNLVWVFFKNMPPRLLWRYLPQHLALNLASLAWYALAGQGGTIVRAKWDAVRGLPRVFRERRAQPRHAPENERDLRRVMEKGLLAPYVSRM
jgi:GT2 family glycosyltransferase